MFLTMLEECVAFRRLSSSNNCLESALLSCAVKFQNIQQMESSALLYFLLFLKVLRECVAFRHN